MHPTFHLFTVVFFGVFAFVVVLFLARTLRFGGFKAAMFGAPIVRNVGEVAGVPFNFGSCVVRVHSLGGDTPERAVGLELTAKTFASYQMMPVTLTSVDAMRLADLLRQAAAAKLS